MSLNKFKVLGRELSKTESKNIEGGIRAHGACNNGAHFSFIFNTDTYQENLAQIRSTICGGDGISYVYGIQ